LVSISALPLLLSGLCGFSWQQFTAETGEAGEAQRRIP